MTQSSDTELDPEKQSAWYRWHEETMRLAAAAAEDQRPMIYEARANELMRKIRELYPDDTE